eukprot:UN1829
MCFATNGVMHTGRHARCRHRVSLPPSPSRLFQTWPGLHGIICYDALAMGHRIAGRHPTHHVSGRISEHLTLQHIL